MLKCKYAGDVNDEGCKTCDGYNMTLPDGKVRPCEEVCGGFAAEEKKQPVAQKQKNVDTTKSVGTTRMIGCKSGISKEINGIWYKFEAWEEIMLPENANVEDERNILFDKLNSAIDNQVIEVMQISK